MPQLKKLESNSQDFACLKVLSLLSVVEEKNFEEFKTEEMKTQIFEMLNETFLSTFDGGTKTQSFERCGRFLMILLDFEVCKK